MRVEWQAIRTTEPSPFRARTTACAAVRSSPLPMGEGGMGAAGANQSAGYSNGSLGVGSVGSGIRGRGSSRLAAFSRKLARMTAA